MNAKELYDYIKFALSAVGLEYSQMEEMEVSIEGGKLVFEHEGIELRLPL